MNRREHLKRVFGATSRSVDEDRVEEAHPAYPLIIRILRR